MKATVKSSSGTLYGRLGNKGRIAHNYLPYFPNHDTYIEPFFGAGGMFFNKPRAKYNLLNDLDDEVYAVWQVMKDDKLKAELLELLDFTPCSQSVFNEFLRSRRAKEDKGGIWTVARFLYLSNLSYMGKGDCFRFRTDTSNALNYLKQSIKSIFLDAAFVSEPYQDFLNSISFRHDRDRLIRSFVFADPPYWSTVNNYQDRDGFSFEDFTDLLDFLIDYEAPFAVCELLRDETIQAAEERGLGWHSIIERQSMKKRDTEILITNYTPPCKAAQQKLF